MSADLNTSDYAMAVSYENNILGEKIDSRYGIAGSILTVFLFQLLNRLVISVGTPKSVPEKDDWKWRNLVISWIHALICSVWDLSCFVLFPEMWEDLIVYANFYIYSMVTFSAGYFVYDFIDMYINNKLFKLWEVTLHHIAVAGMFIYNILVCTSIAYNCIALLAEVNSFFLHSRKLLQMLRVDYQSRFYRITVAANLVTFVVFRGLSLGGILYGMYYWRVRVPIAYYLTLAASMVIMTVMNPILFYRLLKNDFLRSQPKSQVQKSQMVNGFKENGVNNNVKHNKDL